MVLFSRDDERTTQPLASPAARQDLAARVLVDLQSAVAARDPSALDPDAGEAARTAVVNAARLKVTDFTAGYVAEDAALSATLPDRQWAAAVDTTWRFAGFDVQVARDEVTFIFAEDGERARLVSVHGGTRRTPLWLATPLEVSRTPQALVMAPDEQSVVAFAERARVAVRSVRKVIARWSQKLVIEIPESDEQLDHVLGAEPGEYSDIAAVTSTVDGSLAPTSPVHVFINPQVFGGLQRNGAQVVITHELVHVATDAVTSQNTPLWLLEGFADYVALRKVALPLSVTAGQVRAQVRRRGVPGTLPGGNEFDTRTTHLGAAYESAWLVCRLLVRTGSERDLLRLYRDVSAGATLNNALREIFGFDRTELVARWQAELEDLAR